MAFADKVRRFFKAIGAGRAQGDDEKATTQAPTLPGSDIDKVNELTGAADPKDGEPPKF